MQSIGKIKELELRKVWPHEAADFTPWLEAHPEELGEILGLEIEFVREQSVGQFSLDLFGRDKSSNAIVIVENQLEKSNHSHLGQLLTYAGGFDPSYIVWIASEIRGEHKAALEWLNSVTNSETFFFGIEVKAIQIGDSLPAPLLDVVVQPNTWSKRAHDTKAAAISSDRNKAYFDFWQHLIAELAEEFPGLKNKKAQPQQWLSTSSGISNLQLNLVFTSQSLRVEFYFGGSDEDENFRRFKFVEANKSSIEALAGRDLVWEPLDGRKSSRISTYGAEGADVMDSSRWPEYVEWFRNAYRDMRRASGDVVEAIRKGEGS
jgi:hypothetical protein